MAHLGRAGMQLRPPTLPPLRLVPPPRPTVTPIAEEYSVSRRQQLLAAVIALLAPPAATASAAVAAAPAAGSAQLLGQLDREAREAYAARDFQAALKALDQLVALQPDAARWWEMRAQARVDAKSFDAALSDFDSALRLTPAADRLGRARLLAGRGLAMEGASDWVAAIADYDGAIAAAAAAGELADPYILNSRGNCHASLGEWRAARADYLASAEGFRAGFGFSRTARLDGAVYSAGNAALMLAQLGDEAGALAEVQATARKAPGSVDMRAALAALYWAAGDEAAAEGEWEFACFKINAGCSKYTDADWVFRIRRWPPVMAERLRAFLALRSTGRAGGGAAVRPGKGSGFRE